MARSIPASVSGRDVVFGSGPAAAAYAATRVATGHDKPIVLESRKGTGGVFADLANFRLNSANGASVRSVLSPGPTRVPPMSDTDDLNWIPNSPPQFQVRNKSGMVEYPYSQDMAKAVRETLDKYAEVYTESTLTFDSAAVIFNEDALPIGQADRIIWAAGLTARSDYPQGPAIMSGMNFLRKPIRDLRDKRVALVGGGDTAAQVAEFLVGQGVGMPTMALDQFDWYGGEAMPTTKDLWMTTIHARWSAVGRHFPQLGSVFSSVINPYQQLGSLINLGGASMVNGQVYDLTIMANGVAPVPCPTPASSMYSVGGMPVARYNGKRVFVIGTAANLGIEYRPWRSRFPAAKNSLYNQLPRVAAFAASMP